MVKKCYIGFMVAWMVSAIIALLYIIYINVAYLTGGTVHITGVQFWLSNAACWLDLISAVLYIYCGVIISTEHPDVAESMDNACDKVMNIDD